MDGRRRPGGHRDPAQNPWTARITNGAWARRMRAVRPAMATSSATAARRCWVPPSRLRRRA
eukprot:14319958-Alexandrium_andersonii.AAC.1